MKIQFKYPENFQTHRIFLLSTQKSITQQKLPHITSNKKLCVNSYKNRYKMESKITILQYQKIVNVNEFEECWPEQ